MVTKRNTKVPPGQAPTVNSMINDIHQRHRRILERLDKIDADTTALTTTSPSTSSNKHTTFYVVMPESSSLLQRHADYNIHDRIHSCSSPDDSKLGNGKSVKTTTKGKRKRKRTTQVAVPESTRTESKGQYDIKLAKEKGFKILRLVISFRDADAKVKEGMILPIRDDCGDVTRTATSIILRGYTDYLYYLPYGNLEFKINVTYITAPNDAYHLGQLEFIVDLCGDRGHSIKSTPGNLLINHIWSSLSSENFFFDHDRLMAVLGQKSQPDGLVFSKLANGRPHPNSLVIRSTPAMLPVMEINYQSPTVVDEEEDTKFQPAQTTHTAVKNRPADGKSLKPSTSKKTSLDTLEADKAQHSTTPTRSNPRLLLESQQPHESNLAVGQARSHIISTTPPASLTQHLKESPIGPLPANWYSGKDNNSKTYFYNDKIDIAMYTDPRTIQHPDRRELILVPATKEGNWSWEIAKNSEDLPLWSHPAGIFCVFPPSETTEKAMSREAIRAARGGLAHSMRKLWSQESGSTSCLSQQSKSPSLTAKQVLNRLESAFDAGPRRIPLPANWHSDMDGSSRNYFYNDKIDVATFADPRTIVFADRRESILDNVRGEIAWQEYETVDGVSSWVHSDGVWCLEPPWLSTEEVESGKSQRILKGGLSSTRRRMIGERSGITQDLW